MLEKNQQFYHWLDGKRLLQVCKLIKNLTVRRFVTVKEATEHKTKTNLNCRGPIRFFSCRYVVHHRRFIKAYIEGCNSFAEIF